MTLALDEEHCGVDTDIVYPNVQSCVALAVGTAGGSLAGMHLTILTTAEQVRRAGQALAPSRVGKPDSIVCIGNMPAFKSGSGGMTFPGILRQALKDAFGATCNVDYFDTSVLYGATGGGLAFGGVVVRAWRDGQSNRLRYAAGAHTCATRGANAVMATPWFKVSSVRTTDLTGKTGATYALAGLSDVPVLGLATM